MDRQRKAWKRGHSEVGKRESVSWGGRSEGDMIGKGMSEVDGRVPLPFKRKPERSSGTDQGRSARPGDGKGNIENNKSSEALSVPAAGGNGVWLTH